MHNNIILDLLYSIHTRLHPTSLNSLLHTIIAWNVQIYPPGAEVVTLWSAEVPIGVCLTIILELSETEGVGVEGVYRNAGCSVFTTLEAAPYSSLWPLKVDKKGVNSNVDVAPYPSLWPAEVDEEGIISSVDVAEKKKT